MNRRIHLPDGFPWRQYLQVQERSGDRGGDCEADTGAPPPNFLLLVNEYHKGLAANLTWPSLRRDLLSSMFLSSL